MPDLTPEEEAFFETGELPASLAPTLEPVIEPSVTDPVVSTSAAPVPDVADMLRRSLAEEQQRYAEAKVRLDTLERQLQEKLIPKVETPDPSTDPLGNMMHQLAQVNANVTELQNKLTQEQQNSLLKQQFEQFTTSVRDIKAVYEKTVPDFNAAYEHIRTIRAEDLRSVGILESEIPKVLLQDELNIAQNAIQRGKNPAEEIYNMAKRYGYATKAGTVPATQKIADLKRGLDASKQLSRASPESELTLEGLKDAGDSDLNKMVQDDKLWAKLVGGVSNDIF